MKLIVATDLVHWADTVGSRPVLSELTSKLIRATAKNIQAFRFPSGDSVALPGYDGRLEATAQLPYIPDGLSVWEFSTNKKIAAKVKKDYANRTASPSTVVPADATYVAVTARRWAGGEKWAKARSGETWKAVRVLDAVDLEEWLQSAPAVAWWFATDVLNKLPSDGVLSADAAWKSYAGRTNPRTTEDVLLAGRKKESEDLLRVLSGPPVEVVILADSAAEALNFWLACIRRAPVDAQKYLIARTLVVNSPEVAERISVHGKLTIGVSSPTTALSKQVVDRGNFLIVPLGNDAPHQTISIRLPRPGQHDFTQALEAMGFAPGEAAQLSRTTGRSVTVLQRLKPGVNVEPPIWSRHSFSVLIPALLAGGWDSSNVNDRSIVAGLARDTYEKFEEQLLPLLNVADQPIVRVGTVWQIVAPVDCFVLTARNMSQPQIDILDKLSRVVFSETDPALDMEAEKRPYAALENKVLSHSTWLRDGLANTLLMISALGESVGFHCGGSPARFVERLVSALPRLGNDTRLIASLQRQLPLLMEAAPDPFLEALERLLEGDGQAALGFFSESQLLAPSSPHTGLLWGLETLAWDPKHLTRVSLILGRLAKIDPGGRLANRPIDSLRKIFLSWYPGTTASLDTRMRVLDAVIKDQPLIGWDLLVRLLPGQHRGPTMPAHPPRWAEYFVPKTIDLKALAQVENEIVFRALQQVASAPDRWEALIKAADDFSPEHRGRLYEQLEQQVIQISTKEDRLRIWSAIRNEVNRHAAFQDAPWALPAEELTRLRGIADSFAPSDIIEKNSWLFDPRGARLPVREEFFEALGHARRQAVMSIFKTAGIDGLLRLAASVERSSIVGSTTAEALRDNVTALEELFVRAMADSTLLEFASGLAGMLAHQDLETFASRFIVLAKEKGWPVESVVAAIRIWPDQRRTWDIAASFGTPVERLYWSTKHVFPLDAPIDDISFIVSKCIEVGRAAEAISAFAEHANKLPVELLLRLLDRALVGVQPDKTDVSSLAYWAEKIFEVLATRPDASPVEVARREYKYLPLLTHAGEPKVLHGFLSQDPKFFVEVLRDVFRSETATDEDPTSEEEARGQFGYQLLNSWKTLPGMGEDGTLRTAELEGWVAEARTLAAESDRRRAGDQQIGRLFAHAPPDPDDRGWPHRAVRNVIETVASNDLERGLEIQNFNNRGVVTKGMREGGAQERKLAEQAKSWASLAEQWPRTARMLRRIASEWEAVAKHEDERAKLDEMQYG